MADAAGDAFGGQAPHTSDAATGVSSWILHAGGVLHRLPSGAFIEGDIAMYLAGGAKALLKGRFPTLRKFTHVFDLSNAVGYSTQARQILTNWALSERAEIEQLVIIAPPQHTVLRMGISTMLVTLRNATVKMDLVDGFGDAVKRFSLRPA